MALIENPALATQISTRVRPRAETIAGLAVIVANDIAALQAIPAPAAAAVLNDGTNAPIPFTGQHWADYLTLLQTILAASQQAAVVAAVQAAVVRPIDLIVKNLAASGSSTNGDPATNALAVRIRPRAAQLRAKLYVFQNDIRILAALLFSLPSGTQAADTINEQRTDGVQNLTVGTIQAIVGYESAMVSGNTVAFANAVDAACLNPLQVS